MVNMLRVRSVDNWADGSQQFNVAAAQIESTVRKGRAAFAKDLEFFAGAHIDWFDGPGYYSNMLYTLNISDGYDPEMFFFLQLEVFVRLKNYFL
ncbi:hypothetical protein R3P38DRAFT_3220372 [Favolaschia claudopus]|uniref:Uncharacterized protein n=1 Tax=Favolaschia claudopus TaxID=2862362 RepID=A0AAW0A1J0_9AGAR